MRDFLQHVLVQRAHLQVVHTFKNTKKSHWIMGGVHMNDI